MSHPIVDLWKISKGILARIGCDVRSNAGLSHKVLFVFLDNIEQDLSGEDMEYDNQRSLPILGVYLVVCYCRSLRGCEGFMIERCDLIGHIGRRIHDKEIPHVVVPLLERFQGETGEHCHFFMMVNKTKPGIEVQKWVKREVFLLSHENLCDAGCRGNAFSCDKRYAQQKFPSPTKEQIILLSDSCLR